MNALLGQPNRTLLVVMDAFCRVMSDAVDRDRKTNVRAVEVENVGAHRVLPTEPDAVKATCAKTLPNDHLWWGHPAP